MSWARSATAVLRPRLFWRLHEDEGFTYREIGELFGLSTGRAREIAVHGHVMGIHGRRYSGVPLNIRRCSLCGAYPGEPHVRLGPG